MKADLESVYFPINWNLNLERRFSAGKQFVAIVSEHDNVGRKRRMKQRMAIATAIRRSARQLLEPGRLAVCPSTLQTHSASRSSQQESKCHPCTDQRPFSARAGTFDEVYRLANAHHAPSISRDDGHLQMRLVQHQAGLAQGRTDSSEVQGSIGSSRGADPGVPQPASVAPAGMLG